MVTGCNDFEDDGGGGCGVPNNKEGRGDLRRNKPVRVASISSPPPSPAPLSTEIVEKLTVVSG